MSGMHQSVEDEDAERYIEMTQQTCLLALDKAQELISKMTSYSFTSTSMRSLGHQLNRAIQETKRLVFL